MVVVEGEVEIGVEVEAAAEDTHIPILKIPTRVQASAQA